MSGGAMALPTVVAREPGAYDGAVLIAGGVDFWRINVSSNYADWIGAVDVAWSPEGATDRMKDTFADAYRRRAPLDGVHTVAVLRDKPTLIIHGLFDKAVPAALGDEMWTLLGKPDRIELPVGHEVLFFMLEQQHPSILEHLRRVAEDAE
jgi:pimeloyl-ACP methyl ester carboxylesterase